MNGPRVDPEETLQDLDGGRAAWWEICVAAVIVAGFALVAEIERAARWTCRWFIGWPGSPGQGGGQ